MKEECWYPERPCIVEYPGTDMLRHAFPLRPDCEAALVLPKNLTLTEVRRLAAFLETLPAPPGDAAP